MTAYAECWAPESLEQAEFLIDTSREGPEFWQEGERLAARIAAGAVALGTVVEYGCGVGRIIGRFPALRPVGVDVSPRMLELASDRFPHVSFLACDGSSIPLPAGSVDFVFSVLVLQHMDAKDAASVVSSIGAVLRPGGRAWLSFSAFGSPWTPDATIQRGPLRWHGDRTGAHSPAHQTLAYTFEIIEALASQARLRVLDIDRESEPDGTHPNLILHAER